MRPAWFSPTAHRKEIEMRDRNASGATPVKAKLPITFKVSLPNGQHISVVRRDVLDAALRRGSEAIAAKR